MKGKRLILLFAAVFTVLLTGNTAVCTFAGGLTASAASATDRPEYVKKTLTHVVPCIGHARNSSRAGQSAFGISTIGIGGFSESYGMQLAAGSLERTIYDKMVDYFVRSRETGSLNVPCQFTFSGVGDWEQSDEYKYAEEDLEYAVETACCAVLYDYPELFWVNELIYMENVSVSVNYEAQTTFSGKFTEVTISFSEIYSGAGKRQGDFFANVSKAKSEIASRRTGSGTFDTLKAIHNYVCEKIVYPTGYDDGNPSSIVPSYHSSAGLFLDGGVAVCEGYAKSFMILCREFNIPAILVIGEAGGVAHMWNYVQVNGGWYAVDATWDDVEGIPALDTYFMVGSGTSVPGGTFGSTRELHTRFTDNGNSKNFNYPILNSTAYRVGSVPCSKNGLHDWVVLSETKPTCTTKGTIVNRCTKCGETTSNVVAALGHSYHEKKYVYNNDATVLSDGTKSLVCDNGCGTKKLTVTAPGTKLSATIKLNVSSLKLKKGQATKVVKVSGLAKGDSVKSWSSANPKIAKVSSSGKITAQKKTGTTKITVTLKSGRQKTVKVTVQKKAVEASKISGVSKSITLKKGKTKKLTPVISPITCVQKVTYKSSDKKVVTVSSSGKLKAKKKGKATITIKCGKKTFKCKVTVK